ncbi:MAG: hypothetical protein N2508_15020 [Anaerolineae bacterium]|nr:hypothetical protein [Anaerolineae bacterium]
MKRLLLALLSGLALALVVSALLSRSGAAVTVRTVGSGYHFLPPYLNPRDRFGFDFGSKREDNPLSKYDVTLLHAGWYLDGGARIDPPHPDRLTYVQLVRFYAGSDPYNPALVTARPDKAAIAQIAAAHPGSLWLMSSEPDSLYLGNPLYPAVYAHVYHEYYHYIKGLDPTALIANGGIVQPTPCRMQYLDIVWNTYLQAYGEPMPVDVWNIHAFILREVYGSWGASTPPGVPTSCARDYKIRDADNINIFRDNLIAFRQWMKDKGQQNKPLIITEYGILWPEWLPDEDGRKYTPARVSHFMTRTFNLFLYEQYPEVGYPADDYRLVQAWAWYSLFDDVQYNGYLFRSSTKTLSPMGQTYATYTAALSDTLYTDLVVDLKVDTAPLEALTITQPPTSGAVYLPVRGYLANMGKQPANNVLLASPELAFQSLVNVPARYTGNAIARVLPSLALTQCGVYTLTLVADPNAQIDDPRRWNNTYRRTVHAGPDLAILTTTWQVHDPGLQGGVLHITSTVANLRVLATPRVSGTLWLSYAQGSLVPAVPLDVPAIPFGKGVTVTGQISLPCCGAVYSITLEVDHTARLPDRNRGNNRLMLQADTRPDLVVSASLSILLPDYGRAGALTVSITTTNAGIWTSPPVSATVALSDIFENPLLPVRRWSLPPLEHGASASHMVTSELSFPAPDVYLLHIFVDSGEELDEQNEMNNSVELTIPVVITAMLQPDSATYFSSTSGLLVFLFPTGTVTLPTEIRFTPLWPRRLPPGPPLGIMGFNLSAYRGGQPISLTFQLPVTVIWTYEESDLAGLKEDELGLYQLLDNQRWQRVRCPTEERLLEENRLRSCLTQLGTYIFGGEYRQYVPCVMLKVGG